MCCLTRISLSTRVLLVFFCSCLLFCVLGYSFGCFNILICVIKAPFLYNLVPLVHAASGKREQRGHAYFYSYPVGQNLVT